MRKDLQRIKDQLAEGANEIARREFNQTNNPELSFTHSGHDHIALPSFLIIDPILEPVDKIVYSVIRFFMGNSIQSSDNIYPTYNDICKYSNIGSHATVARALSILEITRWIVRSQVRTLGGQQTNVYATQDQPMPMQDAMDVNDHYEEYLGYCTKNKHNRVRNVALALLTQHEQKVMNGEADIFVHPSEEIMEAKEFIQGKEGSSYFGCTNIYIEKLNKSKYSKNNEKLSTEEKQELSTGENNNRTKKTSSNSEEPIDKGFRPSSNIEEYNKQTKRPSSNSEEGINKGSSNFEEGVLNSSSKFEEPSSSSSYYNTTTTTQIDKNVIYRNVEAEPDLKNLIQKRFSMLSNQKHHLISRYLMRIPEEDREPMIFEVSNRLRFSSSNINNPVAYLGKLCGLLKKGECPFTDFADSDYKPTISNHKKPKNPHLDNIKKLSEIKSKCQEAWNELKFQEKFYEEMPNEVQKKSLERAKHNLSELTEEREQLEQSMSDAGIPRNDACNGY